MPSVSENKLHKKFAQYRPAVEIINGFKYYGVFNNWHTVLKKFSLTAYPGELYVILGPHGCGKSTVLNIILGHTSLTQGTVEVFGYKPGTNGSGIPGTKIGYTPQNYGLYENFTLGETMKYHGALLGLSRSYIDERMAFLEILLSLPSRNTYIGHCPETIKRQISFAIALLHEPELLILDEPTAGVDPVLRKSIWSHLQRLTYNNKTVIISTTSATESRNAHRLGIMRSGYLLLEGRPQFLLEKFQESSIEELYFKVYTLNFLYTLKADADDSESSNFTFPDVLIGEYCFVDLQPARAPEDLVDSSYLFLAVSQTRFSRCKNSFLKHLYPHPKRLLILVLCNFLRIFRAYGLLISYFVLPILLLCLYGRFIGGVPVGMKIGVINEEANHVVCKRNISAYASCLFLDYLQKYGIQLVRYKKGNRFSNDLLGHLIIGSNISEIYYNKTLRKFSEYNGCGIINEDCCILVNLDETDRVVANQIVYFVINAARQFVNYEEASKTGNTAVKFLEFSDPFYGSYKSGDNLRLLPGLFVLAAFYHAMLVGPLILLLDYERHRMARAYLAGVKLIDVIISQLLSFGFLVHVQVFATVIVVMYYADYVYKSSCYEIFFILMPLVLSGYMLGLLGISLFKKKIYFFIFIGACYSVSMLISGLKWSYYSAPEGFKPFMIYTPHFMPAEEIRWNLQKNITMKDTGFPSLGIVMAWAGIFLVLFLCVKNLFSE